MIIPLTLVANALPHNSPRMELFAVIVHKMSNPTTRTVVRGHYVTLARRSSAAVGLPGAPASSWHLFDDAHVTPVPVANVPQLLESYRSTAAGMFYARV